MPPSASGTAGPVPDWINVEPSDMSFDQLAAARQAVQSTLDQLNAQMAWLNSANMRLSYEVSDRFKIAVPGLPPVAQMATYPSEQVRQYAWPEATS